MTITLIGYKSCGKTSTAKAYATEYQLQWLDTDDHILAVANKPQTLYTTVADLYQQQGEITFRRFEKNVIQALPKCVNTIIATGGGVILDSDNVDHLKALGTVIYLYCEPLILKQRLLATRSFPSFIDPADPDAELDDYLHSRHTLYAQAADHTIDVSQRSINTVISQIYDRLHNG